MPMLHQRQSYPKWRPHPFMWGHCHNVSLGMVHKGPHPFKEGLQYRQGVLKHWHIPDTHFNCRSKGMGVFVPCTSSNRICFSKEAALWSCRGGSPGRPGLTDAPLLLPLPASLARGFCSSFVKGDKRAPPCPDSLLWDTCANMTYNNPLTTSICKAWPEQAWQLLLPDTPLLDQTMTFDWSHRCAAMGIAKEVPGQVRGSCDTGLGRYRNSWSTTVEDETAGKQRPEGLRERMASQTTVDKIMRG